MDVGRRRWERSPMLIDFKRPKWLRRPRSLVIGDRLLRAAKRSRASFLATPKVKIRSASGGKVDAAFKAEVEVLLGENAELLRRLAR
jgi:hypothetical protein